MGNAAASTWDKEPGLVARFLASTATNSAREPSRYQSVSPNTSPPTPNPVVPYPRATTVPETSCPGITGRRSLPERSTHVDGHCNSVGVKLAAQPESRHRRSQVPAASVLQHSCGQDVGLPPERAAQPSGKGASSSWPHSLGNRIGPS